MEREEERFTRMKDEEGRIAEGEDEVLKVMARHWDKLGRSSEDDAVPDTAMGDVGGGCKLSVGMCDEVSWEEVVDVMRFLK